MIPAAKYTSHEWHQKELETFFPHQWLFAGLLLEMSGLCHVGVKLGTAQVLIQVDVQGRPRAFRNVCSHRSARLCEPGLHSGPIRCPYHGWVYDRDGVPVGIPQKQAFPLVTANPTQWRLDEFSCEAVGQFIFVRLANEGPSIRESLGSQYDFLLRASEGIDSVIDGFDQTVDANWKAVIENSLEGYHIAPVHSKTLLKAEGMDRAEAAPVFFMQDSQHSHLEHATNPEWLQRFGRTEKQLGRWPWRFEHYTHHHIFPNLTVTSFMGYSFHVQVFRPVSVDQTQVTSRTLGVPFSGSSAVGKKMIEKIYQDGHEFTRRVFAEDAKICREVQEGLTQSTRLPVLGIGIEDRIAHFQNAYSSAVPERA